MPLTVCVSTPRLFLPAILRVLNEKLDPAICRVVHGEKASDFAEAKAGAGDLILLIESACAHEVIKDLCDDYAKPTKQRRVKWIYSLSAGVDSYRLHELTKEVAGVQIFNARGCFSYILAEHTIFSMLYFNRQPWRLVASKNSKKWDRFNMVRLAGQKLCIFGYGNIGQACGERAVALGMKVTGVRQSQKEPKEDEKGVRVVGVEDGNAAVPEADFILGVLPGIDSTKHFFNLDFFRRMKPSAVFINIGRGTTQCEVDIVEALQQGVIRGAALDVFEKEPLPETSPLWGVPNDKLLISAHCADWTEDIMNISALRFVGFLEAYQRDQSIEDYNVDIEKGY